MAPLGVRASAGCDWEVVMTRPPGGAGLASVNVANVLGTSAPASFSVEVDQLPALKKGFQDAQDELIQAQQKAKQLQFIPSPGHDRVSQDATSKLAAMAGSNSGQLGWALDQAIASYQKLIDQCDTIMQNYKITDETAAQPFKP